MRLDTFSLAIGLLAMAMLLLPARAEGATWIVAPTGGDFTTIQAGLDAAFAGDIVLVKDKPGGYHEAIVFPRSGDITNGPITLAAFPGESPAIDGTGLSAEVLVLIENRDYVVLDGFEIRNRTGLTDGSGIRVLGAATAITLRNNRIHDLRGNNAMGITVYGTSLAGSITALVIENNEVYDCDPAPSEAITLNGNVENFAVIGNYVHDVDNIGIDFIGGETEIHPTEVARSGVCRGNRVVRANSSYGGGYGAGIYVDGGRDIVIEHNEVTECDLGIEIGAENNGFDSTGIVVRDNLVHHNDKVGIVFGGFNANVGRTRNCEFIGNTCFENDTSGQFLGEVWIQFASENTMRNNIFYSTSQNVLLYSEGGNVNNTLDRNVWFSPGGANGSDWVWQGTGYSSYTAYRNGSGQDANSMFADPQFVNAAALDFGLAPSSPAVDAGDPADAPNGLDFAGFPRWLDGDADGVLRVDAGARERSDVRLDVTGSLAAGATLSIDLTGTAGLSTWILAGPPGLRLRAPFGYVFLDLGSLLKQKNVGALPVSIQKTVPAGLPVGMPITIQAATRVGNRGTLSNPVTRIVE